MTFGLWWHIGVTRLVPSGCRSAYPVCILTDPGSYRASWFWPWMECERSSSQWTERQKAYFDPLYCHSGTAVLKCIFEVTFWNNGPTLKDECDSPDGLRRCAIMSCRGLTCWASSSCPTRNDKPQGSVSDGHRTHRLLPPILLTHQVKNLPSRPRPWTLLCYTLPSELA